MGSLLLVASTVVGIGLISRFFPFTGSAERFFWGIALGNISVSWIAYVVARLSNALSHAVVVALTVIVCGAALFILLSLLPSARAVNLLETLKRDPLLLCATGPFVAVFACFFYKGMFHSVNGVWQLTLTSWYDMALHLAFASSFAYGHNFPPQYLLLPGEALHYPALPDFHAAMLLKLGTGVWPVFALTSSAMALSLVGTFYCFARRLLSSGIESLVATLLFFLNGGLGFLFYFRDFRESHTSFSSYFLNMKENYTDYWNEGIKWANIVTSGVIPQRAMLYGMPIGLVVLTLFAIAWRRWAEPPAEERWTEWELLLPAGVITGLLSMVHVHSYFAVGFISCGLFLIRPRLVWIAFWIPALVLAVPSLLQIGGHLHSPNVLHYHLGWMSYLRGNFVSFLVRNFGLPLFLIAPAIVCTRDNYIRSFYIPFAALMVFCFFFGVSPNDFDNLKLMYYGYTAAAVVIAGWLCRIATTNVRRTAVVLAILVSTASGALAIVREIRLVHGIFDPAELEAGYFARKKLPPKALFLSGQYHNQPVLCLAGKPLVLGYEFWVSSHGYSRARYDAILRDVKTMYLGAATSSTVMDRYGVDYIYVGPKERAELAANELAFSRQYVVVFRNTEITIYDRRRRAATAISAYPAASGL